MKEQAPEEGEAGNEMPENYEEVFKPSSALSEFLIFSIRFKVQH